MLVRNISQVKAELSALLESVQSGEDVAIAKAGKPIARLVQFHGAPKVRTPGILDGQRWIAPDLDELPADIAEAFGIPESPQ